MRYLLLVLILTGCSTTVPVTAKFPDVPERLLVKCPKLEKLEKSGSCCYELKRGNKIGNECGKNISKGFAFVVFI